MVKIFLNNKINNKIKTNKCHKNALPKPGRYEKGLGYESTSQNAENFLYIVLNSFWFYYGII